MAALKRDDEIDYLRRIEGLAHGLVALAANERWFGFGEEGQLATKPLQRAINELATQLRVQHYGGDGCVAH